MTTKWKVGDPVVVTPNHNGHGGALYRVAKLGPKLLTVGDGRLARQFRLDDDGRENTNGVGGYCYARTPEEHAKAQRRNTSRRLLTDLTTSGWINRLTVEQMDAIVAILTSNT